MRKLRLFVTGGAGYIGSHFVKNCYENSQLSFEPEILIYDDLSRGSESNILYGELVVGSLDDHNLLRKTIREFKPDVVVHFAAYISVGESEQEPWVYFKNNTGNTLSLLKILEDEGISRFVFSSTAAVYGNVHPRPISEADEFNPVSVYGMSKAIVERILLRSEPKLPFRFVSFRYFNVCGADPAGRIGQNPGMSTHLITKALETALGHIQTLSIFGTDYNTPDGTGIRDYVHVEDLVNAHILGVEWLLRGNPSEVFNLGSGVGHSVKEVIDSVQKVVGKPIHTVQMGRREGDPDFLVADPQKAQDILGWKRQYSLTQMIEHAYSFQSKR